MNWIKYLVVIFCCFLCLNLSAQNSKTVDVIHMKNGSVFRGEIVEYVQGDKLRLRINEHSVIVLEDQQIRKIVQQGAGDYRKMKKFKEYAFKERGFYNVTYLNAAAGTEAWSNDAVVDVGMHNITGYQFNRMLGVGLGVGIDYYYISSGENIIPIYAEARGYFLEKNTTPMYSLAMGYGIALKNESHNIDEAKGGLMFYPALGYRLGGSDNANWLVDFGVKIQKADFTYDRGWEQRKYEMTFNRFIIRVGLMF